VKHTTIIAAMAIAGCAASPAPTPAPPKPTAASSEARPPPPRAREAKAEQDAQRSWCGYLKALYLRADKDATEWSRFDECMKVKSTAAPQLLEQTASCSLRALNAFQGDPFNAAYAREVARCGTEAIGAIRASRAEIEPFITDLCGRATACGAFDAVQCRASFDESVEAMLEHAVGAMNRTGRDELHACLRGSSCEELQGRIKSCLEPIVDRLLWLPS